MSTSIQYLTNAEGEKIAVVLPIAEYEELIEDLHDLAVLAKRRDEPTIPLDEVIAELERQGRLP
ncbi:MAG: hypothetical protein JO117_11695 [Verrucomicrobia bacterium]|nr:hypothetical protein [Verrucomicrobiota bacterium]